MTRLEKLLNNLPSYYDKESYPLPIFKITYVGELTYPVTSVTVDNDNRQLIVKDPYNETTFNTEKKNIGEIKTMLTDAGFVLSDVTDLYDKLYWFVLCEITDNAGFVYYEQSLNRRFFSAYAQFLNETAVDYDDALNEAFFYKARSFWLDLWGRYFGHTRLQGEDDDDFFNRIMFEILSPKDNNISLEKLIEHLIQYKVTIRELGTGGREMFYTNKVTSITNCVDDLLQKNTLNYPYTNNAFAVLVHSGNLANLGPYERQVILRIINKYKATGNFPVYFAPTALLRTNVRTELTNDANYNVSPTTKKWQVITIT